MGFEPTTCRLATDGSTAELRPQKALSGHPLPVVLAAGGHWSGRGFLPSRFPEKESRRQEVIRPVLDSEGGGGSGTRTHGLRHAMPTLFQLSYTPVSVSNRSFFNILLGVKDIVEYTQVPHFNFFMCLSAW